MPRQIELAPGCRISYETQLERSSAQGDASDPDATYETVWIGATRALCWMICECPEMRNSNVLELGCGQGLAGMFCVEHAGASRAVLTDVSETALAMVEVNAKLNDIGDRVTTAVLDVSRTLNGSERYDFVVASDMLFSSKIAREVFAACRHLIKPGGTILLGHEKRYSVYRDAETGEIRQESVDQPLQVFLGLSQEENWSVQEVSPFPNEPNLLATRIQCI
ncbi:hypothetical protein FOZ61_001329 [Perkinsus olseni]|uniref:Uncharacterized protein n=1 Tax=Perkinsus olseni TaxID=32597 RepID=A0A7J6LX60_PEROL|nr:hypothetical protein FOZ61_001329 [Perkinsus olseni]